MGYKTKPITPTITQLSVYQAVPSKFNSSSKDYEPDTEYFLRVKQGLQVRSTGTIWYSFYINRIIRFQ